MTREEAILYMELYRDNLKDSVSDLDKDIEAYNMAINALSAIKDIRREIKEVQGFAFRTVEEYEGLRMALDIIDNHIRKEN